MCGVPVGVVVCFNIAVRVLGDGVINLYFRNCPACDCVCLLITASAFDSCDASVATLCNSW